MCVCVCVRARVCVCMCKCQCVCLSLTHTLIHTLIHLHTCCLAWQHCCTAPGEWKRQHRAAVSVWLIRLQLPSASPRAYPVPATITPTIPPSFFFFFSFFAFIFFSLSTGRCSRVLSLFSVLCRAVERNTAQIGLGLSRLSGCFYSTTTYAQVIKLHRRGRAEGVLGGGE